MENGLRLHTGTHTFQSTCLPCCGALVKAPIDLPQGSTENVDEFPYLGSLVASNKMVDTEVNKCIANASKSFGALRCAVFKGKNLTTTTKWKVYQACVLSVLLYGAGCWTPLRRHLRRLDSFHHRCIRTILGITNQQQWQQRIPSASTREQWGDIVSAATKVAERWLEWLGHLAWMQDNRIPKKVLFVWLPKTRPACGPQRRWRDLVSHDLKYLDLAGTHWYEAVLSRLEWRTLCSNALKVAQDQRSRRITPSQRQMHCRQYQRWFRREADKAQHSADRSANNSYVNREVQYSA